MNWGMLGHEWAVELLAEHVRRGEVRHAYLFCGPQGVGRRTLALRFTQSLNCQHPPEPGQPCGACRVCKQIERMQHADLFMIQAEEQGGTLKVDQIRELQRSLALHPYEATYRVAVMLRFEEAHTSAMNALLKPLEEPAPKVVLILTAESAEILLPTIVSRCEVLRLRPLPVDLVSKGLQNKWGIKAEQADFLAHISGGRPGFAIRLFQEPERLEQRQYWLDQHDKLLLANRLERFHDLEVLSKNKATFRMMLLLWITLWREVLLRAAGASGPFNNPDRQDQVEKLAVRYGFTVAFHTVSALSHTLELLDLNINTRLAAEVLMLDLPQA
jgi:DNA polymerase-3 subunit delta'